MLAKMKTNVNKKTRKIPVFSKTGHKVGVVQGQDYIKILSASKHFLQKPPSIAIDLEILQTIYNMGVKWVVVKEKESGKEFCTPIRKFFDKGIRLNRGFGIQVALPLIYWDDNKLRVSQLGLIGGGQ